MRNILCAALLVIAILSAPARAVSLLGLSIIDRDTGQTLPTHVDGVNLYVAGTPGHRYSVRLSNCTGGRVLAVLSVDGVNAVSGQTANADQTGYVLGAGQSAEINGWRKNLDEVAQFNFTALPNSYAARTGRPANVGVIGVAVFTERKPDWRERESIARESAPPAPASAPMDRKMQRADSEAMAGAAHAPAQASAKAEAFVPREERLGTGHGAREIAHVDTTTFVRASRHPAETVAIWYDSYANLVARGIMARPIAQSMPTPFPGTFVPDPMPH